MSFDSRLKRIVIENFRSIKRVDFSPSNLCALVGENNCGKTNILRALNLVLGETYPTERSFSDDDFHGFDTSKDVVIQVFFTTPFPYQGKTSHDVHGLELRCKAYKRRVGDKPAGTLKTDYSCLDDKGNVIQAPTGQLVKGQKYTGGWQPLRVPSELREQACIIYIDVMRDYGRHEVGSRWSALGRLFKDVNTQFLNDKTTFDIEVNGAIQKLQRKEAFKAQIKKAFEYLKIDSFTNIEKLLADNAIEQMGIDKNAGEVSLRFQAYESQDIYKNLELCVDQLGITSSAKDVGAGLQSAIVIAIFRTYQELKKSGAIIAIEEPEVFLHPQKARYFSSILKELSEKGNQIILSTHSPIFVSLNAPESNAMVSRSEAGGTSVLVPDKKTLDLSERQQIRVISEFDAQRSELFFAKKILFVEGNTEKIALPLAFKAFGHDINKLGISVIECGGKTKIPLFVKMAKGCNIPFHVMADLDHTGHTKAEDIAKHKAWNQQIENVADKINVTFVDPDFEGMMGISGDESQKIDNALNTFSTFDVSKCPATLKQIIEKTVSL